jgi:hypothetical protein
LFQIERHNYWQFHAKTLGGNSLRANRVRGRDPGMTDLKAALARLLPTDGHLD